MKKRLGSTSFNQFTRFTDNPNSIFGERYRFTELAYLTGISTRLLTQNESAPAAPGGASGSQHDSLARLKKLKDESLITAEDCQRKGEKDLARSALT